MELVYMLARSLLGPLKVVRRSVLINHSEFRLLYASASQKGQILGSSGLNATKVQRRTLAAPGWHP